MIRRTVQLLTRLLSRRKSAGEAPRPKALYEPYIPRPLPQGWPERYKAQKVTAGGQIRWVVVIDGIPTMAPAWETEEMARRDAWERQWIDEMPKEVG